MSWKQCPQMFAERAFRETPHFTRIEQATHDNRPVSDFGFWASSKHIAHFVGESLTVFHRIKAEQLLI